MSDALRWAASHSRPASDLADTDVLRHLVDGLAVRLDGGARATSAISRWRKILYNLAEYAIKRKVLVTNPLPTVKQPAHRIAEVDRRCVANPSQARDLLAAVAAQSFTGQRLEAYFGCLYYAALRPEAAELRRDNLDLPGKGWGWIYLEAAEPHAGGEWTNTGNARDDRPLKQREPGEVRKVPSPPDSPPCCTTTSTPSAPHPTGACSSANAAPTTSPPSPCSESGTAPARQSSTSMRTSAGRAAPLRPAPRRRLHLAQLRRPSDQGRGLGRTFRRRPAQDLRHVRRRRRRAVPSQDRRSAEAPPPAENLGRAPGEDARSEPSTTVDGWTQKRPSPCVSAGEGRLSVAPTGFEPALPP